MASRKFLWDANDSLEEKIAKSREDQLYREYCISDLSGYKTNKVALRWRTKQEVISGKGELVCGNKTCDAKDGLKSWEVNFRYVEDGAQQNALVKLRLCGDCSVKLNYNKGKRKPVKEESRDRAQRPEERLEERKPDAPEPDRPVARETSNDNVPWSTKTCQNVTPEKKIEIYLSDLFL